MSNRFLIVCGGTGYKLLGQRNILGIDSELQIDVSKENVSVDWQIKDARSRFVDLDKNVGTTAVAFNKALEIIKDNPNMPEEDKNHAQALVDLFPTAQLLERGLAQSPAVGRATISHPNNKNSLEQEITIMFNQFGQNIGPENPVEVWIVSSTAGGTGEGTHLFVARKLIEHLKAKYADTSLTMNFIRVGQLTYRSINNTKTPLNTFLGVAMDAAYMLQVKQEFPLAVTNWFYIDLPDVGKGDKAKRTRGEIVEMACKAIMLPELQDALQLLLANNVGAPVVLVRTGYWGRDFGGGQKFFETLKQLLVKLTDLVEPNYERKYVEGRPAPQPSAPDLDDRIRDVENTKYVREHVDKGWTFPRYRSTGKVKDLGRFEALIKEWKNNLRDLLEADIDHISVDFRVEEKSTIEDETQRVSIPLNVPATIQEDAKWFNQINDAHRVKGWADKLLGLDYKDRTVLDTGMIEDLLQQGEQISKIFYTWNPFIDSAAKIKDACSQLGTFLKLLAHANRLIELEKSAERLLVSELSESREVLKKATEEFEFAKNSVGGSSTEVVRAAELDSVIDPLTKKTWLRLLRDAVKKGETEKFHAEVLRGATGLTKDGLCMVLGLKPNADIIDIQNELATNIGHMVGDNNKEFEGQWWQANSPTPVLEYSYRILPQVDRLLQAKLSAQAYDDNIDFKYVFTEFGTIGLYVLAFLGVSLNQANGDTLTAPVFLLKPLLAHVKEALAKWSKKPESRMTSGQLDIVAAGSGGQALYERALLEAGLTPEEVAKLAQFYKMYN